jgi:hypothetical protein
LSRWATFERNRIVVAPAPRQKSGVRAPRQPKPAPFTSGDAFGELEAMLEEQATGNHRTPGDAPVVMNSAGAPSHTLAAPQSLP